MAYIKAGDARTPARGFCSCSVASSRRTCCRNTVRLYLSDLPLLTGEVRYERGFFDSLLQRVLAFVSALMVFLQTLYSPDAAKQYQERNRRNARSGSSGSGTRLGGQSRIHGMSNLGGSSGNGTCILHCLREPHGSIRNASKPNTT